MKPEDNVNLILRAKSLIDGSGDPPVSPGLIAIAEKEIVYAGPEDEAPALPCAETRDFPASSLLPGLIDMHVHPTYYWDEPDSAAYTYDPEQSLVYSDVMIALLAAANLREALLAGVTTARDTGSVYGTMFDVKRAVTKGLILGPKLFVAGRLVVPTGGHVHYLPGLANEADGPYGFRRAVREEIRAGADYIKIANRGSDLTFDELQAAVDEAHRRERKVACHTNAPPSQQMAIEAGVDTFEHGTPTREDLEQACEKGITWIPTLNIGREHILRLEKKCRDSDPDVARCAESKYAEAMEYRQRKLTSVEVALDVGMRIATGTDSYLEGVRFAAIADEIAQLVEFGCTPMQGILAATSWPAEAMGWEDIGSLESGKLADVIVVEGDPLADIEALENVTLVVREGIIVKE
jgi:imidazolonepropionase-like amidohydrolase